jgi:hypothetical protein
VVEIRRQVWLQNHVPTEDVEDVRWRSNDGGSPPAMWLPGSAYDVDATRPNCGIKASRVYVRPSGCSISTVSSPGPLRYATR